MAALWVHDSILCEPSSARAPCAPAVLRPCPAAWPWGQREATRGAFDDTSNKSPLSRFSGHRRHCLDAAQRAPQQREARAAPPRAHRRWRLRRLGHHRQALLRARKRPLAFEHGPFRKKGGKPADETVDAVGDGLGTCLDLCEQVGK